MAMPSPFTVKVVGVSFVDGYPQNIFTLNDIAARRYLSQAGEFGSGEPEPLPAVLMRNPGNEHDPNAIEVHVPSLGDNGRIGYIPAAIAARLAPLMDGNEKWSASVVQVAIDPNHPTNPGILLKVEKVVDGEPF